MRLVALVPLGERGERAFKGAQQTEVLLVPVVLIKVAVVAVAAVALS
jgi:hypothetical protein